MLGLRTFAAGRRFRSVERIRSARPRRGLWLSAALDNHKDRVDYMTERLNGTEFQEVGDDAA
jgi:hypothetical protein